MKPSQIYNALEICPVVAAVRKENFDEAINSPAEVIFLLEGSVMTLCEKIEAAHQKGKMVLVHIDLIKGIGKDKCGVELLHSFGADGIISTRAQLIKFAKEIGIIAVQRCFAVDSQGVGSVKEMINTANPDFIEIMPGVITKVISDFALDNIPVIAGGLIETKAEVTAALSSGAAAVSTGKNELWYA